MAGSTIGVDRAPYLLLAEDDPNHQLLMRRALAHKLAARPALGGLLRSTHPHPLLALKEDAFWGVRRDGVGENMLARLWMELRASTGT